METLHPISQQIITSRKYQGIAPVVVERIVQEQITKVGEKKAEDAARQTLHQVWGAYRTSRPDFTKLYDKVCMQLEAHQQPQEICGPLLLLHSSTKERVSYLNNFYAKIFEVTGEPESIADYACGLNPLTYFWMNLPTTTRYWASDIDVEEINFLQRTFEAFSLSSVTCEIFDLLGDAPFPSTDVAFLHKTLQVLEHQRKDSASTILQTLHAQKIVVSFPLKSLGNKDKGMATQYQKWFLALYRQLGLRVTELFFPNELVCIIYKL